MSDFVRLIKPTEVFPINLDNVYPGLLIINKFHPLNNPFSDASFEQLAGIKKGGKNNLIRKTSI